MIRNKLYMAVGVSGIALAAITAGSTPSLAAVGGPAHAAPVPQRAQDSVPVGGAPQHLGVNPGPGGGASQGLSVRPSGHAAGCPNPAAVSVKPSVLGVTGPACESRVSSTSANAQNIWNFGGAELGGGAANLISAAFFGIPSFALDLIQGILHVL
jgi:hypothetical protein